MAKRDESSKGVGLLISVLVRYPELSSVNFDPHDKAIKFSFILTKPLDDEGFGRLKARVRMSVEAYGEFKGRNPAAVDVSRTDFGDITVLEVCRDVDTLTQEEISLVIEIVREMFGGLLAADRNDNIMEEDLLVQEEIIDEMLQDVKDCRQDRNIIAFREEGRVVVFNK
ncbi:MAG: hypothetical protein HPY55_15925 [Firmicutes bacterium]|nr:hypothetical protein [Bacillota bacterium]